jgi:hypothetical protein
VDSRRASSEINECQLLLQLNLTQDMRGVRLAPGCELDLRASMFEVVSYRRFGTTYRSHL